MSLELFRLVCEEKSHHVSFLKLFFRGALQYDNPMVPGFRIIQIDQQYIGKHIRVICTELPAGPVNGREAFLFPGEHRVRLKEVSSLPGGRMVLTLKGVALTAVVSGAVLLDTSWPVCQHREALLFRDGLALPGGNYTLTGGVYPGFNAEGFVDHASFREGGAFFRLLLPCPYPMLPGMQLTIHGLKGGARALTLFHPGVMNPVFLKRWTAEAKRKQEHPPEMSEIYGRLLSIMGFQCLPPVLENHRYADSIRVGNWVILTEGFKVIRKSLKKLSSRPGGINTGNLQFKDYPKALLACVATELCNRGELIQRGGWYFPPGDPPLSPFHRSWLERVRQAGEEGFRVRHLRTSADIEALKALGRSGLILGGEALWLASEVVDAMSERLFADTRTGGILLISDVRTKIGRNRTLALELLGILASTGKLRVKNDGVSRVIL